MREPIRVRDGRTSRRQQLAALTLAGCVLALLAAPSAEAAGAVKDVRVGKHATYTRIVFELDRAAGYQIERNEPAPGISELVVSLEASGVAGKVDVPKSLIDAFRLQSDGQRTVAHIRLAKDGLRVKEMTLSRPPRIVIDIVEEEAKAAAVTALPAPKPAPKKMPAAEPPKVAKSEDRSRQAPPPSPVAVVPPPKAEPPKVAKPAAKPVAPPVIAPEPSQRPLAGTVVKPPARPTAPPKTRAARPIVQRPSDGPSDPTAPSGLAEPVVPAARSSLPPTPAAPEAPGGLFTARNGALALAGVALLVAGSYVIARRRRDSEDYAGFDDDEFADDNPFAGFQGEVGDAEEAAVDAAFDSDASPSAMMGSAATSPTTSDTADVMDETEGIDVSMDGTTDFDTDPDPMATLGSASGMPTDGDGVMQMVRELATRVGDLETRLEDAVDAKERLERQVAVQTEELRVQRAAIARTQRAVRNMSQPSDDAPTEPAPRVPRSSE